jgi:hypothetical protein
MCRSLMEMKIVSIFILCSVVVSSTTNTYSRSGIIGNGNGNGKIFMNDHASAAVSSNDLCFLNAISSHHYHVFLQSLYSIQSFYPCILIYLYDLGLVYPHKAFLHSLPYLTLLKFHNNHQPYYTNGVILFKPAMLINFIQNYGQLHHCRYILYGHSNLQIHRVFDSHIFHDLYRHGLVLERELLIYQSNVTSAEMYQFFNKSRGDDIHSPQPLRQTSSGLMLIDATNQTIKEILLPAWAECITNPLCLNLPKNITETHTLSAANLHQHHHGSGIPTHPPSSPPYHLISTRTSHCCLPQTPACLFLCRSCRVQ